MQQLFDFAEMLGVTIEYRPLRSRDGEYRDDLKRINLREDMPYRLMRSTLAHELGHAAFGDVLSVHGPLRAKQERRADEWAALRLITLERYREAEIVRDGHVPSMAHDLAVVTRIVEAYQRVLTRIGDSVYLNAKLGTFAAKFEVA